MTPPQSDTSGPRPQGGTRVLACPFCGGSVKISANGISTTVICASCGSTLDVTNPDVRLIAEARERTRESPIPIGKRATLVGTEWEVIGFQTRSDTANGWSWNEYLLFNPYRGFRFLSYDGTDWTLYCMLRQDVSDPEQGFGGRRFTQETEGIARTDYVLGEFYWRVRVGDLADVCEYVDGPYVLSREENNTEVIWSRGVRLPAETVRTAFGLPAEAIPPATVDKAALRLARNAGVKYVAALALMALLLAHTATFGTSRSLRVLTQTFHTTTADKGRTLATDSFEIPEKGGNLRITAYSRVYNDWVQLDLSLVGPSDIVFHASPSIEYYNGVDSDGSWSEGSQSASVKFASVPGGSYRLFIEPYAGAYAAGTANPRFQLSRDNADFSVTVTRHVPSEWNFALALLLLTPYPIYRFFADRRRKP